jgi:hypothetical protein
MKLVKSVLSMVLIITIATFQSGCSLLAPGRTNLTVVATEPNAQIYINGQFAGQGTGTMQVPTNQSATVMAKKDGFFPATQTVGTRMSTTGVLDIIGGCIFLIPFFGLLSAGSSKLETNIVNLNMAKQ